MTNPHPPTGGGPRPWDRARFAHLREGWTLTWHDTALIESLYQHAQTLRSQLSHALLELEEVRKDKERLERELAATDEAGARAVDALSAASVQSEQRIRELEGEREADDDNTVLQVLCRVFDDGADRAMEEWFAWYRPGQWLGFSRALGAFIRQRVDAAARHSSSPPGAPTDAE